MPLIVDLLRRDPKVRVRFGGHRLGSRSTHAVRGCWPWGDTYLPRAGVNVRLRKCW